MYIILEEWNIKVKHLQCLSTEHFSIELFLYVE